MYLSKLKNDSDPDDNINATASPNSTARMRLSLLTYLLTNLLTY